MRNFKTDSAGEVIFLADENATTDLAANAARVCREQKLYKKGVVIYLKGDLGAGKSFFSRAFIQSFLPGQKVKSPTYTLVESYDISQFHVHHFDLYRLCDPEELEYLAVRELLSEDFVALVEWPQKGEGVLPEADVQIELTPSNEGRQATLRAFSGVGQMLANAMK